MSVDFHFEDGVAIVTINRPERLNAMDAEHYAGLSQSWIRVRDDPAVRVAIITGAGERAFTASVRYRTVGDMTVTGAVESHAGDVEAIVRETAVSRITERGQTRADDRASAASMEDRKREGYF